MSEQDLQPPLRPETDIRSTQELVQELVFSEDTERSNAAFGVLVYRDGKLEFEAAKELAQSAQAKERMAACWLLGNLGDRERDFYEPAVEMLINLLADAEPTVVAEAARAAGLRSDDRVVPALTKLCRHRNSEVRLCVAEGLKHYENPDVLDALIHLSRDDSEEVREMAAVALAQYTEVESQAIADALYRLSADPNLWVRGEALVGLAQRQDPRALDLVIEAFQRDESWGPEIFISATCLADPSLVEHLEIAEAGLYKLPEEDQETYGPLVADALEACRGEL